MQAEMIYKNDGSNKIKSDNIYYILSNNTGLLSIRYRIISTFLTKTI